MILSLIINFSILFTFIVLAYFLYEFFNLSNKLYRAYYPIIIGIGGGVIIILLMKTSLQLATGVIGDARATVFLLVIMLGGPISGFITAMISGLFRVFYPDFSCETLIFGINTFLVGTIISLFAIKMPINWRNVHVYLIACVLELACFVIIATEVSYNDMKIWIIAIMNCLAFYATYVVLHIFKKQFAYTRSIERIADTDYLTGMPNNRIFREQLKKLTEQQRPFALVLMDIDHFRTINQQHGHLYGDEILKQLAVMLEDFASTHNCMVARVSSDEFYFICYDAAPAIALTYAAELRLLLDRRKFALSNGQEAQITMSFSVVNYPDNAQTVDELVQLATSTMHEHIGPKQPNTIVHVNHFQSSK
ncbi:diguanylate cyclase [Kurthia massiliensis]|uniref:diguanylate cyclase n=1 Tax=Kurthia massiliensis TaxID=1033739 RepID=UPI000287BC34|nr:diguanylate cyclase [Kurthia massiliensis]